ncbi:4-hydroxy-4-methyl-2-oxoglutarate aldolase [compost metagenome]
MIDGVATDLAELCAAGLPVFARGTSQLTTKLVGTSGSALNVPVTCGGVPVQPGDLVMADDNGVLILPPAVIADVIDQAQASDRAEPGLLVRLRAGERLESVLAMEAPKA